MSLTDSPPPPELTTNNEFPTDGDSVTLTCLTQVSGITSFVFEKDGIVVAQQPHNTHTINPATLGTNDGTYTCRFFIGTFESRNSTNDLILNCEFNK